MDPKLILGTVITSAKECVASCCLCKDIHEIKKECKVYGIKAWKYPYNIHIFLFSKEEMRGILMEAYFLVQNLHSSYYLWDRCY